MTSQQNNQQDIERETVYAEYVREQERIAARRYRVTLYYDAHPLIAPRAVWEGTGFWIAAQRAQDAAKSLIARDAHAYVEHDAENTRFNAYRRNWSRDLTAPAYILEGHAEVVDVTE